MDLNKRLEDEELVGIAGNKKIRIKYLHKQGIFTIKDFLECDINKLFHSGESREKISIEKDILSYKYLDEPLSREELLVKKIDTTNEENSAYQLKLILEELGFGNFSRVYKYFNKYAFLSAFNNRLNDSFQTIDYLRYSLNDKTSVNYKLILFYVNYYDTVIYNKKITLKSDLEELKDYLITLLLKRREIEKEIENVVDNIQKLELTKK